MFTLGNDDLLVEFLDPASDQARLGPRYAWGGYIWQVRDLRRGQPLLSGPQWPKADPTPFNGQGLPESFRHRTRDGRPLTWSGERGVALGAGEIAANAAGEIEVVHPCKWAIAFSRHAARFHTRQQAAGHDYELVRQVDLDGRTLRSSSILTNHGSRQLELEWFAHPFFALPATLHRARVLPATTLLPNPGFALADGLLTQIRPFVGEMDGHMDFLHLPVGTALAAQLAHPQLENVRFATSFTPSECIIWGNGNTFSIEPYLALSLAPGETKSWEIHYGFDANSGTVSPAVNSRVPETR